MEKATIKREKIRSVEIDYGLEGKEWLAITVNFVAGLSARVTREQVETFLRVKETIDDLQQVEKLRDQLLKMFGSAQA